VPAAVVRTVRLDLEDSRSPTERLLDYLRDREILLVLDNFEHLLPAAAFVLRLLTDAPRVRVLVTSQAPLHLAGEQEFPLAPLPIPPPHEANLNVAIAASPCLRLFADRAAAVRPDFVLDDSNVGPVLEICDRLQGLPLAIELAAAQIRLLSPAAIVDRVSTRIDALSARRSDAPERQRTLHAAVAWSYDLLDPAARAVLQRLSAFAGGGTLEQLERVSEGVDAIPDAFDALSTLVDRSLVRPIPETDDRYAMLETIRSFASARLAESGDEAGVYRRHAEAFVELVERAEPELYRSARRRWLERLASDHDNIRVALDRMEAAGELEIALRIAAAVWRFWQQTGHLEEAEPRIERLLAAASSTSKPIDPGLLSRVEEAAGGIAYWRRTSAISAAEGPTSIERHYLRSLELARQAGDPRLEAKALYNLSFAYDFVAATTPGGTLDRDRALSVRLEALERFRALGDERGVAYCLWGLASPVTGDVGADLARGQLQEAAALFRAVDDAFGETWSLVSLGMLESTIGSPDAAIGPLAQAARLFVRDGDRSGQLVLFDDIAALLSSAGEHRLAVRVAAARDAFGRATGAMAPPIPLFRQQIAEASAALEPETLREETELGAGVTFGALFDAVTRAEDRGIEALAGEIALLGASTDAVVADARDEATKA
jgi:predicted ATPase